MIDIENNKTKQKVRTEIVRIMARLERGFYDKISSILRKQYTESANLVAQGDIEINYVVNKYRNDMMDVIAQQYKKAGAVFSEKVFTEVDRGKKEPVDIFWQELNFWIRIESFNKATTIEATTKKILRTVILKGMNSGLSHLEIAKKIKEMGRISTRARARTIARTETHGASVRSIDTAMKSTKLIKEKEWVSALDERTRDNPFDHIYANGERVGIDERFIRTGESLRYPGDSSGSAGNVVNCRCISLFHTIKKLAVTQPAESIEPITLDSGIGYATTVKEAKKQIEDNFIDLALVLEGKKGGVRLGNIPLETYNEIARGLDVVLGKYKVKVSEIGKKTRKNTNAYFSRLRNPQGNRMQGTIINYDKDYLSSPDVVSKRTTQYFTEKKNLKLEEVEDALRNVAGREETIKYFEELRDKLLSTKRFSVPASVDKEYIYATTLHESYHAVSHKYNLENIFSKLLKQNKVDSGNRWNEISEYAATASSELFAEIGTSIELGYEVPSILKKVFQETIKEISYE